MEKRIYKNCGRCGGRGEIRSHTPERDDVMFGLLDFGITAAFKSIKGRLVTCPNCYGDGVVLDRIEVIN